MGWGLRVYRCTYTDIAIDVKVDEDVDVDVYRR